MDIDLMTLLAKKEEVYYEIEHWTNKSLGMRSIAVMFDECYKEIPDLELDWMYPVTDYDRLMAWWFPWLSYTHIETRETMSDEIDIIVLHVWVNNIGKSYIALEEYYANGVHDPDPPEWYGIAAGADWSKL